MIIDTHAHIYLEPFDEDREAMLQRAREAGVGTIVMPAIDLPSIERATRLCRRHEDLYAMAALHPSETKEASASDFDKVATWCEDRCVVAVGESGLDYYWDRSFDDRQQAFFRQHIRLSIEKDLPLVIHNREATEDVLRILQSEREVSEHPERLRGILHCFVDGPEEAEVAAELGFLVGLGGILTFKNSDLAARVREIPLGQIVLETDAPYLAPEPHRGKRNEPAYVRHVAEKLAEVKEISLEEVGRVTTKNAQRLYGLEREAVR